MDAYVMNKHILEYTFANLQCDETDAIEMKSEFERCFHSQATAAAATMTITKLLPFVRALSSISQMNEPKQFFHSINFKYETITVAQWEITNKHCLLSND